MKFGNSFVCVCGGGGYGGIKLGNRLIFVCLLILFSLLKEVIHISVNFSLK